MNENLIKEKTLKVLKEALVAGEERIEHLLEHKKKFEQDISNINKDIELIELLLSVYRKEITTLDSNPEVN